jgi:hypothetical protein
VTIPEGVTEIGSCAFADCTKLTSVTIPSSVTTIGSWAFAGCSSLSTVDFKGTPPSVGSYAAFDSTSGSYLQKYASEWEAVIDADGKWNGLTMMAKTFFVTLTTVGEGAVTGAGEYVVDETVTVTATPNEGYVFCGWSTSPVTMDATYSFALPRENVSLTAYFAPAVAVESYVSGSALMSKEEAKQVLLDADEVFTADEMKEMAFDTPVVEVKNDVIEIAISLQTAESLDAWQAMALQGATLEIDAQKGQVRVKVPKGDKKAAFYKFVVPNEQ